MGLAKVRPEDRKGAFAAFLTIFGTLAGHTLLETARDALFLARLPASRLAFVYIAIAACAVAVSQSPWGRRRAGGSFALSRLLGGGALVTFLFWLLLRGEHPLELYALYVWTGLLGSLAVLQFWMVLGELYTLGEAKRLYSLVWTGSLLGATAGAAAARILSTRAPATMLVLAAAIVLAVTALGPAFALGRAEAKGVKRLPAGASLGEGLRLLRGDAYLRALAVLVLVSTVALTLADYVFKSVVARTIPAEQLGSFFAGFYMLLNLLSLGAQLVAGGWLFQAIGLHRALWVLPSLIFVGASGLALGGGLAAALLLKGTDGALRNSLHRTGTELLFVPLAPGVRARAKPLVDIIGQRGGQAIASVLILSESVLRRGDVVLAGAAAATALVWIALVSELKGLYLDVFRVALREGTLRPALDLPPVDLASLETLIGALNSADDHEVLAAIDLLAAEGRARLVPALILYHPSQAVVLRALQLFAREGRADLVPIADRLLQHDDAEIRAAALRARTRVAPEEMLLRTAAEDPSPLVRATAAVGRVAGGWESASAMQTLEELARKGDQQTWTGLARAIAAQPLPAFEAMLLWLAERGAPATLVQVARAMGQLRSPSFLPVLLELLGQREVRGDARAALVAYGPEGLAFLDEALGDASLPRRAAAAPAAHDRALRPAARGGAAAAPHHRGARGRHPLPDAARPQPAGGRGGRGARSRAAGDGDARDGRGCLPRAALAQRAGSRCFTDSGERAAGARPARAAAARQGGAGDRAAAAAAGAPVPRRGLPRHPPRAALARPARPLEQPRAAREPAAAAAACADPRGRRRGRRRGAPRRRRRALRGAAARVRGRPRADARRGRRGVALHRRAPHRRARACSRCGRGSSSSRAGRRASSCRGCSSARSRRSATSRRTCVPDVARMVPPLERLLHLKRIPLLSGLPTPEVVALADVAQERFFRKGEVVFREDVPASGALFVVEGRLADFRHGIQVGTVGPGQGIGGMSVLARAEYGSQVVADEDTLALEIDADAILDVLEDRLPILQHMLREVSRQALSLLQKHKLDPSKVFPMPAGEMPGSAQLDLVDRLLLLRRMPVFDRTSITALAELARTMAQVRFEAGTTLWHEGEPAAAPRDGLRRERARDGSRRHRVHGRPRLPARRARGARPEAALVRRGGGDAGGGPLRPDRRALRPVRGQLRHGDGLPRRHLAGDAAHPRLERDRGRPDARRLRRRCGRPCGPSQRWTKL